MGKMTISTTTPKAYANKQRTMNNEHYSKQTQSKPISNAQTVQWCEESHPTGLAGRNIAPARVAGTGGGSHLSEVTKSGDVRMPWFSTASLVM